MSKTKEPGIPLRARMETAHDPCFVRLVSLAVTKLALEKLPGAKGSARGPLKTLLNFDDYRPARLAAAIVAVTSKAPGMDMPEDELASILEAQWITIIELTQEA